MNLPIHFQTQPETQIPVVMPDDLLTPRECAVRLKITEDMLASKSRGPRPMIPPFKIGRKITRYHWPTVLESLRSRAKINETVRAKLAGRGA